MDMPLAGMVSRSAVQVGIEPALRRRLAALAGGRLVVLDYFTSRRCGVTIGDMTAGFRRDLPGPGFVELTPFEGVRVFARARLLPVLTDAAVTLRLGGLGVLTRLGLDVEPPSRWIEFLEEPPSNK